MKMNRSNPDMGVSESPNARPGIPITSASQPDFRLPVVALGLSLGSFISITYVLCVLFDLWFPGLAMYETWLKLLPGFTWLSWPSFFLGLVESFAYGWYIALVFGPLFNYFAGRHAGA